LLAQNKREGKNYGQLCVLHGVGMKEEETIELVSSDGTVQMLQKPVRAI
jgi:hypothetical protein